MLSLGLLSGCVKPEKQSQKEIYQQYVEERLRLASEAIQADLHALNALSCDGMNESETTMIPEGLATRMDLSFDGRLEDALRFVSATSGYRLRIAGKPYREVLVHIRRHNAPCLEILRELGLQTGKSEEIVVNEEEKSIALTYIGAKQ